MKATPTSILSTNPTDVLSWYVLLFHGDVIYNDVCAFNKNGQTHPYIMIFDVDEDDLTFDDRIAFVDEQTLDFISKVING